MFIAMKGEFCKKFPFTSSPKELFSLHGPTLSEESEAVLHKSETVLFGWLSFSCRRNGGHRIGI